MPHKCQPQLKLLGNIPRIELASDFTAEFKTILIVLNLAVMVYGAYSI